MGTAGDELISALLENQEAHTYWRNRAEAAEQALATEKAELADKDALLDDYEKRIARLEQERDEAVRRGEDQWAGWVREEVARKAAEQALTAARENVSKMREIAERYAARIALLEDCLQRAYEDIPGWVTECRSLLLGEQADG